MAGHEHLEVVLRVDHVGVVVVADLELDPVDLAGEHTALHVILGGDRGPGLAANVQAFVGREDERLGRPHAALADLLAVHVQGDVAAFAVAAAVVGDSARTWCLPAGMGWEASVVKVWMPSRLFRTLFSDSRIIPG